MYLQLQNQQQQQWQQHQVQPQDQLELARQTLAQGGSSSHHSLPKRGLAYDSDELAGNKKRNMGSEAAVSNAIEIPVSSSNSPGSFASQGTSQGGYFDQQYNSTASASMVSPLRIPFQGSGPGNGASAPTTPGGVHDLTSFSALSATAPSSMPSSWSPLAQGSFGDSNTTAHMTTPHGSDSSMTASMITTSILADTLEDKGPLEVRFLQEQWNLQELQMQEQHQLQMAQQLELQEVQRHQEEQIKAIARARATGQIPPAYVPMPIHHDHNDPATWGYTNVSAAAAPQPTSQAGGYGRGYTPTAMGGVAALAAMAAASRDVHVAGRGGGSSGMEVDP